MADYTFYTTVYMGGSIPEADFARLARRAQSQLDQYKRIYVVEMPEADSESMAVCAMADALYYFECAANDAQSASVGSVSSSAKQVDLSEKAQARELYRCAKLYLNIYRGCS